MARPHPVIGIATVFPYRRWWSYYQADITKNIVNYFVVFISRIKGNDPGRSKRVIVILFKQFVRDGVDSLLTLHFAKDGRDFRQNLPGNLFHAAEKRDGQPVGIQFLLQIIGFKTVLQVIRLYRTQPLNSSVTAVVIGKNQSFFRYCNAGTSAAEDNHRILQRSIFLII
ncbi:hypothetical protein SDC9_80478 [bioreactor metagenome]|uniref:Uncharacterized protein n=1 Tax=bioreactor metagenome TaxID=1076179 RepID=A0A644YZV5_9ZZZZ